MKTEYLLPLIGVLLGWFLSELSQLFKGRRDNKRIAKRSIFLLIEIRLYLEFLLPILGNILKATSLKKNFNDILKEIFDGKEYTSTDFDNLSAETISNLSNLNPYLALNFKQLISNAKIILNKNFISQHLNPFNKVGIKVVYDGVNLTLTDINELIYKLSLRYNFTFWVKEKSKSLKKKNKKDHWQDLFSKFN